LDLFLLTEELVESLGLVCQWVASGGEYDHNLVIMKLRGNIWCTPSPFKFFEGLLKELEYQILVLNLWVPIGPLHNTHTTVLFMNNLNIVKQATITWVHEKRLKEDQELFTLEKKILDWQVDPALGYNSRETRKEIAHLELHQKMILADKECWRRRSPLDC
jgi:hypothetical protein